MKTPWMEPALRELLALAALAAFGCGLALAQGDFLFVAIKRNRISGGNELADRKTTVTTLVIRSSCCG
jgi:hypothetical protein